MFIRTFLKIWQIGVLAAVLSLFSPIKDAQAQSVTVGGTIYDITILAANRSFNDDLAALTSTPWFGDQTLAGQIAAQYLANFGVPNLTGGSSDFISFAYSVNAGGDVRSEGIIEPASTFTNGLTDEDDTFASLAYATGMISGTVAVPEINGNALAQVLFVLFALSVWLHLRRRRVY